MSNIDPTKSPLRGLSGFDLDDLPDLDRPQKVGPPTPPKVGPYWVEASIDELGMIGGSGVEGTVAEGEWQGFKVGTCTTNSSVPTQSLAMQMSLADAGRIMKEGDFTRDEFFLDVDTSNQGVFCYPFQNSVVNQRLLDLPCDKLFGSAEGDASEKCEQFKKAVEKLSGQQRELSSLEKLMESFGRGANEAPEGILNGFYFALGMAILADLGYLGMLGKRIKAVFKNGNGKQPPTAPTGGGGGGAPFLNEAPALEPVAERTGGAPNSKVARALRPTRAVDYGRPLADMARSLSEEGVTSDTLACWGASFLLGLMGVLVAGAGSTVSGLEAAGVYIGESAGAVTAGALATAGVAAAGFGMIYSQGTKEYNPLVPMHRWHGR